jgi:hypothetical protein
MDITDTSDDDESVSGLSCNSDVSLIEDICLASLALSFRENQLLIAQMNWHRHVQLLLHENLFYVKYWMSLLAFNKLLDLLSPKLKLNAKFARMAGSEPISTEIMLHCTIRYLAGGSYHDTCATAFINRPSFFRLVWHTIDVINSCDTLNMDLPRLHELDQLCSGFYQISTDGVMDGCIGALDGYLMRITAPSHRECGNVSAYFSGHYCTYGVNVQAVCDADCHVYFYSLAAPCKTNDNVAIKKTSLPAWLNSLLPGFFVACDCAYSLSEHLISPYSGPQHFLEKCDNFNFYLSQLCIRIEMAFGLLVTKWRIFHTPINVKFSNLP